MSVQIKKSYKDYMAEAVNTVDIIDVEEASQIIKDPDVMFIDVRDRNELMELGKIAGAEHASRGMLEFFVDPSSPYHNKLFSEDKKFVLYCMSGGRSTLAAHTMQEMGFDKVVTLEGGFKAWKDAGGAIENVE